MRRGQPLRFRCHTGHAFSTGTLRSLQAETVEQALRSAVRALHERELLLLRMAAVQAQAGDVAGASAGRVEAEKLHTHILVLTRMVETEDTVPGQGDA